MNLAMIVESTILVLLCILIIVSYLFDISASRTRIPSVIILLLLGLIINQLFLFLKIDYPNLQQLLPLFGTIGLILIVLEGALELEITREKLDVIRKTFFMATLPFLLNIVIIVAIILFFHEADIKVTILNAIPLSIISSAIAIPSAQALTRNQKEVVVYESSFSDIVGVVFFNFFLMNETISYNALGKFIFQLILIIIISFIFTAILSLLLSRVNHKVKFIPIMAFIILVYMIAKSIHLPALILILVMGIFLANFQKIDHHKWIQWLKPEVLQIEVKKFTDITYELTFLVRTIFFLLFGFLLQPMDIVNLRTLGFASMICIAIYGSRFVSLKLFKFPTIPFLFYAPRGLISILLFISIPSQLTLPVVNSSLITQVIIVTSFVLMIGNILTRKTK